ncbi:MAG: SDR family oxidoreductase [Persicimonas sp.]
MERLKICVLGGSGFVGREVCRLAVAMGHRVVSVSRGGRPAVDEPWVEGVEWVDADVCEPAKWREHLDRCEAVVHCVGIAAEDPRTEQTFERLHHQSVELAAREAEQRGVPKFVFLSAGEQPPAVDPAYLRTKQRAEEALGEHDLDIAILRPVRVRGGGSLESAGVASADFEQWSRSHPGVRRETLAMATLRAALEPDTRGVFESDDIDHLGDAMFIQ